LSCRKYGHFLVLVLSTPKRALSYPEEAQAGRRVRSNVLCCPNCTPCTPNGPQSTADPVRGSPLARYGRLCFGQFLGCLRCFGNYWIPSPSSTKFRTCRSLMTCSCIYQTFPAPLDTVAQFPITVKLCRAKRVLMIGSGHALLFPFFPNLHLPPFVLYN